MKNQRKGHLVEQEYYQTVVYTNRTMSHQILG